MGEYREANGDPREEHARVRELLGPYVMGALDLEEERAVRLHLTRCAACRDEERGLRETHERLAGVSIAASFAPPDLKPRVLDAVAQGSGVVRNARRALLSTGWVAAAVLLLFALVAVAYSAGYFDQTAMAVTLAPTELAPGAGGELEMQDYGQNAEASLEVWGLPQTGPDEYYELWFAKAGGRVSAGTFTVDDQGRYKFSANAPDMSGGYQRVGITREEFPEEPRMGDAKVVLSANLHES